MTKRLLRILLILAALSSFVMIIICDTLFLMGQVPAPNIDRITGSKIIYIASAPGLDGVLAALTSDWKILYSQDGGREWEEMPSLPGVPYYSSNPVSVALAGEDGSEEARVSSAGHASNIKKQQDVYRLTIDQQDWSPAGISQCPKAYTQSYFNGLATSPTNPRRVYVLHYCTDEPVNMEDGEAIRNLLREVYASSDGGQTFRLLFQQELQFDPPLSTYIYHPILEETLSPSPVNPEQVYLGSSLVSEDGGQSWSEVNFPVTDLVLDGVDPDRLYGYLREDTGKIIGMTRINAERGWKDWAEQPCKSRAHLVPHPTQAGVLFMRCYQVQMAFLENYPLTEALLRSNDSGDHWELLSEWIGYWIGPDYSSPGRMLWSREDGLWESTNAGDTWTMVSQAVKDVTGPWINRTPPDPSNGRVLSSDPLSNVWMEYTTGILQRWDGQTWQGTGYPRSTPVRINNLVFTAPNDGWMVGEENANAFPENHGVIYHWDGTKWKQSGPLWDNVLLDIAAVGEQAWAVGEDGIILHYDGQTWSETPSPVRKTSPHGFSPFIDLRAISMVSAEEGWAAGGVNDVSVNGVILHYQDGQWQVFYDSGKTQLDLFDLDMLNPTSGWAVGWTSGTEWQIKQGVRPGQIYHWDGSTWNLEKDIPGFSLNSIAILSENDAWAGGNNSLLHWDGTTWSEFPFAPADKYRIRDLVSTPDGRFMVLTQIGMSNESFLFEYTGGKDK